MTPITLEDAIKQDWDIVLAGSSFAAMFFAHGLRDPDLRVLIVERGAFVDRETQLERRHENSFAPVAQDNSSGQRKDWIVRHQFGGCSNCWWGNTPRLHPSDFKLHSLYGVGQDWPWSYDDLEPYMQRAEDLMEVAGDDTGPFLPRSAPHPYPAHKATRAERKMIADGPLWQSMPTARSHGGDRPGCCAAGACSLCPIDAKFTILNALHRFERPNTRYLSDAECRVIETQAGQAHQMIIRTPAGQDHAIRAGYFGIGTNPISNAAILLRSNLGGDLTGRGLHEQLGQFIWVNVPFDNYYGGTSITGLGYGLYDGDFRREAASLLIESWNAPPSLRHEPGKWLQRLKLKLVAEDLPLPQNRVVLDNDEAKVIWTGHSDYAYAGLKRGRENIASLLPFAHEIERFGGYEPTEAHIIGGTPMSDDPATGVVDRHCRVHGIDNLAVLGAGTFPTGSAANPTLTLSALSLMLAEAL